MPIPYIEATYVPYRMSVEIPDIKCTQCSIQLLYFMTVRPCSTTPSNDQGSTLT